MRSTRSSGAALAPLASIVARGLGAWLFLLATVTHAEIRPEIRNLDVGDELDISVIPLHHDPDGHAGLLILQTDDETEERFLSLFEATTADQWQRSFQVRLADDLQLFDVAKTPTGEVIVGYANQALLNFDMTTRTFRAIAEIPSMFRGPVGEQFDRVKVMRDIDDDGYDDVALADFGGWQLALQGDAAGSFGEPQLVGPEAQKTLASENQIYFRSQSIYGMDHDLDGRRDIAFWEEGVFSVHHQTPAGTFQRIATEVPTHLSHVHDDYLSLSIGTEADNPDQRQGVLGAVDDLDGDGHADLIVFVLDGEGVFGRETSFEIHRGRPGEDGMLGFDVSPSSIISSDGIQFGNNRVDLDGDGRQEVLVASVDLGIGTIVRALLTRSVGLDLSIYRMNGDSYPDEPNLTRRVTATFDFSSGEIFVPAFIPADIDGDGHKDLLLQDGDDELKAYLGTGDDGLFADRPLQFDMLLPKGQDTITAADIDADGVDELILVFNKEGADRHVRTVDWTPP